MQHRTAQGPDPDVEELKSKLQKELDELSAKVQVEKDEKAKVEAELKNTTKLYNHVRLQYDTSTQEDHQLKVDKH